MSLTILILDDDAMQVSIFKNVLQNHYSRTAVEIYFLTDGNAAIEMIGQNPERLNLLISDINHPGLNGLELARLCKEKYSHVKVLIQTAFGGDEFLDEAKKYADFVLQKPYKIHELTSIIDTVLGREKQRRKDKALKLPQTRSGATIKQLIQQKLVRIWSAQEN